VGDAPPAPRTCALRRSGMGFHVPIFCRKGFWFTQSGRHYHNADENAIRPYVVGRKNWLFSKTPDGAAASASMYSIVETAKANGLDPHKYLVFLLEQLPITLHNDAKVSHWEQFMPWNPMVAANCALNR